MTVPPRTAGAPDDPAGGTSPTGDEAGGATPRASAPGHETRDLEFEVWTPAQEEARRQQRRRALRRRRWMIATAIAALGMVAGAWGWREVYRRDFSAAGRMKARGFGERIEQVGGGHAGAARVSTLFREVLEAERRFAASDRGPEAMFEMNLVYRKAIQSPDPLAPGQKAYLFNNAAWFLTTSPHPLVRDPPEALSLARVAVDLTSGKEPAYLDTLAEALFANGRAREALEVEMRAHDLAPDAPYLGPQIEKFRRAVEAEGPRR